MQIYQIPEQSTFHNRLWNGQAVSVYWKWYTTSKWTTDGQHVTTRYAAWDLCWDDYTTGRQQTCRYDSYSKLSEAAGCVLPIDGWHRRYTRRESRYGEAY